MSLAARIRNSNSAAARALRRFYYRVYRLSLPLPGIVCVMLWQASRHVVRLYYWGKSAFWVTPLYRGLCTAVGKDFKAGTFVPYVEGTGRIFLGDNVRFDGKQNYIFSSIRSVMPEIHVGDNTGFGHGVTFDIAGKLIIGKKCLIAGGVTFQDCGGHSLVPEKRACGEPPTEKDVRDITIGDNVWIGAGAYISPGARIGENCVVAANTTVARNIPPNSLVYALPAKVVTIRNISKVI